MNRMNHAAPHRFTHALAVPLLVGGMFVGGAFQLPSTVRNGADVTATALPGSEDSTGLDLLAMSAKPIEPTQSAPAANVPIGYYLDSPMATYLKGA